MTPIAPRVALPWYARDMRTSILVVLLAVSCGSGSSGEQQDLSQPDLAPSVTCSQTGPANANGIPSTCDWTWDCSDYGGASPEFSLHCAGSPGGDYSCECRQAGAVTTSITFRDACISFADAKTAANAACKFTSKIY